MNYEDVYEDDEFEETFTDALIEAAISLPKFFCVTAHRSPVFRDTKKRVTRFSFPGIIAARRGKPREGFIFGEVEIEIGNGGYSICIPELNFQEGQAAFG